MILGTQFDIYDIVILQLKSVGSNTDAAHVVKKTIMYHLTGHLWSQEVLMCACLQV